MMGLRYDTMLERKKRDIYLDKAERSRNIRGWRGCSFDINSIETAWGRKRNENNSVVCWSLEKRPQFILLVIFVVLVIVIVMILVLLYRAAMTIKCRSNRQ